MADRQLPIDAVADIRKQATAYIEDEDVVDFVDLVASLELPLEYFQDQRAHWHDLDFELEELVRVHLFRVITGMNGDQTARELKRWKDIPEKFGLIRPPNQSTISRSWTTYFEEDLRKFVQDASIAVVEVATEANVPQNKYRELEPEEDEEESGFSPEQILRTTRLARNYVFGAFDTERAENREYEDNVFYEFQSYMSMTGCGTAQGHTRFDVRSGRPKTPHGDTHIETVKRFEEPDIESSFHAASNITLNLLRKAGKLREPAAAAIITTEDACWANGGLPRATGSGREDTPNPYAHKYAVIELVDQDFTPVVETTPVVPETPRPGKKQKPKHQIVAELMVQALEKVDIHIVYLDRGFESEAVYRVLDYLGIEFLIPKRRTQPEERVMEMLENEDYPVDFCTQPLTSGSGPYEKEFTLIYHRRAENEEYSVFATNREVDLDGAYRIVSTYYRRWQIENQFKTLHNDFRAITNSRDFRVRYFYFMFRCLLYNIWQLIALLLKLKLGKNFDEPPEVAAGLVADFVSAYHRPIT